MNVSQILIFGFCCTNYLFLMVNMEPCMNQPFELFEPDTRENTQEVNQEDTQEETQEEIQKKIEEARKIKEEAQKKMTQRYEDEYGILNVVANLFYRGNNTFKILESAKKALCSCAIYRVNQQVKKHTDRSRQVISNALEPIEESTYCTDIRISNIPPFTRTYCAPMMICSSGGDVVGILKGYMKKSFRNSEYDVYLCHVKDDKKKGDFYGLIPKVDVK